MILRFGKFKGDNLTEVPTHYLWWLTCWELDGVRVVSVWADYDGETWQEKIVDFLENAQRCAHTYLLRKHISIVWEARKLFKHERYCARCHGVMPAIGHSRSGGANHSDWDDRMLHKSCWKGKS